MASPGNKERSHGWDRAAQRTGLRVERRGRVSKVPTRLEGTIAGYDVTISYHAARSDSQEDLTRYTAVVPLGPVHTLGVGVKRNRWLNRWKRSVRTGDEEWDRRWLVSSNNSDATRVFLNPKRRAAFDELSALAHRIEFTDGHLTMTTVTRSDEDELICNLGALLDAVYQIEHSAPPGQRLVDDSLLRAEPPQWFELRPGEIHGSEYRGPAEERVYCRTCNVMARGRSVASSHRGHAVRPPGTSTYGS